MIERGSIKRKHAVRSRRKTIRFLVHRPRAAAPPRATFDNPLRPGVFQFRRTRASAKGKFPPIHQPKNKGEARLASPLVRPSGTPKTYVCWITLDCVSGALRRVAARA